MPRVSRLAAGEGPRPSPEPVRVFRQKPSGFFVTMLFSPEFIQEGETDPEEEKRPDYPDGPSDCVVLVHIHADKKGTEHCHDHNAIPSFLPAFPFCRISHHAHGIRTSGPAG
jgi:hypothetical protein